MNSTATQILTLLADGAWHPRADLLAACGGSDQRLRNTLASLRRRGYGIFAQFCRASHRVGYRLLRGPRALAPDRVAATAEEQAALKAAGANG